jgi:hypothetical protein
MVILENTSLDPVTLPYPFAGVLKGRQRCVVAGTIEQVRQALGASGLAAIRISEANAGASADSAFNGHFMSPYPTGNESMLISDIGHTSDSPVNLVLLPAGHPAGLYEIHRMFMIRGTVITGKLTISTTWNDPNIGASAQILEGLNLFGDAGHQLPIDSHLMVKSDGTAPIVMIGEFSEISDPDPVIVDVYAGIYLQFPG